MTKAPRVTGARKAPRLPVVTDSDLNTELWAAVMKSEWTLEEAAHFVWEITDIQKLSGRGTGNVCRTYVWLKKESEKEKTTLLPSNTDMNPAGFSPGDVMRFLWEAGKHVSLKVWSYYTVADDPSFGQGTNLQKCRANLETAARIICEAYPDEVKRDVIDFLQSLPGKIANEDGTPMFLFMGYETLRDLLKNIAGRYAGRTRSDHESRLKINPQQAIELIKKKMGN